MPAAGVVFGPQHNVAEDLLEGTECIWLVPAQGASHVKPSLRAKTPSSKRLWHIEDEPPLWDSEGTFEPWQLGHVFGCMQNTVHSQTLCGCV